MCNQLREEGEAYWLGANSVLSPKVSMPMCANHAVPSAVLAVEGQVKEAEIVAGHGDLAAELSHT